MTVRHEFGSMGEVGDIIGALGFPRLRLWNSVSARVAAKNVEFGTFFCGTIRFDPFEAHLGVPIQNQFGV